MFEDKDDVRHLFMCQTAIATIDIWRPWVDTKRCCLFFVYVFRTFLRNSW